MRTGKMMGAQRLSRVLWGCAVLSEAADRESNSSLSIGSGVANCSPQIFL